VLRDVVVERNDAALGELQDAQRGQELGHGRDGEDGVEAQRVLDAGLQRPPAQDFFVVEFPWWPFALMRA